MARAFNSTTPNLNWAVNRLNYNLWRGISNINNGGGGPTASNEQVETAIQWAINKANTGEVTYSQVNRNLKNPSGWSFDCSSFVITAFYYAGIDVNATYTGDMKAGFTAAGFVWHDASSSRRLESSILQRGDILLNIDNHTQMYIGNNQDVNCGSTPARVLEHNPYYNWSGASTKGWDGFLRYGS